MPGLRRQGRIFALQLLYQLDVHRTADAQSQETFWDNSKASRKAREFASALVRDTLNGQERIDALLKSQLEHWKLSRLSIIVRNVLRLAVCEMWVIGEEPPAVIINEALELTREFMDEDSAKFVNSVLDKCRVALLPEPGAAPSPNGAASPG